MKVIKQIFKESKIVLLVYILSSMGLILYLLNISKIMETIKNSNAFTGCSILLDTWFLIILYSFSTVTLFQIIHRIRENS